MIIGDGGEGCKLAVASIAGGLPWAFKDASLDTPSCFEPGVEGGSLSFIHKSFVAGPKSEPGDGEVVHSPEADPDALRARRRFAGAIIEPPRRVSKHMNSASDGGVTVSTRFSGDGMNGWEILSA